MRDKTRQKGLTLIELLVTVSILGVSFVVIVGGLGTAILGSDVQRRQVTAEAILRTAADALLADDPTDPDYVAYVDCASTYALPGADPAGYTREPVVVRGHWRFGDNEFKPPTPSCTNDDGLQLIELSVTSDNRPVTETVQIVKRRP